MPCGSSRTRSFRQAFLLAYASRIGDRLRAAAADAVRRLAAAGCVRVGCWSETGNHRVDTQKKEGFLLAAAEAGIDTLFLDGCGRTDLALALAATALDRTRSRGESHPELVLVYAGLLTREKRATWVFYRLVPERMRAVRDALAAPATVSARKSA